MQAIYKSFEILKFGSKQDLSSTGSQHEITISTTNVDLRYVGNRQHGGVQKWGVELGVPIVLATNSPRHACLFETRLVKLTTFILCTCSRLSLTDEHSLLGPCIQDINRGEHRYLLESW